MNAKLFRDAVPMGLYGPFRSADRVGNLLIEFAANDQVEDLQLRGVRLSTRA